MSKKDSLLDKALAEIELDPNSPSVDYLINRVDESVPLPKSEQCKKIWDFCDKNFGYRFEIAAKVSKRQRSVYLKRIIEEHPDWKLTQCRREIVKWCKRHEIYCEQQTQFLR